MSLKTTLLMPLSLALIASACGSDNDLSQGQARRAFVEVMTLSTTVGSQVQSECAACQSSVISSATGSLACPGGGTVDYNGQIDDGGPITMDLSLDYSSCSGPGGITVDGSLDYSTSLAAAGDFAFSMLGALQFSGAVSGSCDFDLSLALSAGAYSAQGDLCGSSFSYP